MTTDDDIFSESGKSDPYTAIITICRLLFRRDEHPLRFETKNESGPHDLPIFDKKLPENLRIPIKGVRRKIVSNTDFIKQPAYLMKAVVDARTSSSTTPLMSYWKFWFTCFGDSSIYEAIENDISSEIENKSSDLTESNEFAQRSYGILSKIQDPYIGILILKINLVPWLQVRNAFFHCYTRNIKDGFICLTEKFDARPKNVKEFIKAVFGKVPENVYGSDLADMNIESLRIPIMPDVKDADLTKEQIIEGIGQFVKKRRDADLEKLLIEEPQITVDPDVVESIVDTTITGKGQQTAWATLPGSTDPDHPHKFGTSKYWKRVASLGSWTPGRVSKFYKLYRKNA